MGEWTHDIEILRIFDPEPKASPHEQPHHGLEAGVRPPPAQSRHQQRAEGIQDYEYNRHDNAVSHQYGVVRIRSHDRDPIAVPFRAAASRPPSGVPTSTGISSRSSNKRIAVRRQRRLGQVELEDNRIVVLNQPRAPARRGKRVPPPPRPDPAALGALQAQLPTPAPALAVRTPHIGRHRAPVLADATPLQHRQLRRPRRGIQRRHDVVGPDARAHGDVPAAVLVHDEHVGPGHARARAQRDPLVRGGRRDLEVDVARLRVGRRRRHPDAVAHGVGVARAEADRPALGGHAGAYVQGEEVSHFTVSWLACNNE